jgi:FkbM family methyltransferase
MTLSDDTCVVIDAGARYGLHPTWSDFKAPLLCCCFEPDPEEAERLKRKYADATDRIRIEACALADAPRTNKLYKLRHHAASGFYPPIKGALWFKYARPNEGDILETLEVPTTTIDHYCEQAGLQADFLKLDTEGSELRILKGAVAQLENSVLGIRSEVNFDATFEGQALFHEIHAYLIEFGFLLVNLDYDGRGLRRNDFVDDVRYGTLDGCDAVWVKRPELLQMETIDKPETIFKLAGFCMVNHAPDLSIDILENFLSQCATAYWSRAESPLFQYVATLIEEHFYRIRDLPGRKMDQTGVLFQSLFGRPLKRMHEYYEGRD